MSRLKLVTDNILFPNRCDMCGKKRKGLLYYEPYNEYVCKECFKEIRQTHG